ncbi:MAG: hypothetical protein FD123_3311 [Bacteroidetes bacterium]|nr:MAG: hypothetical protein FD123_3311 [Bacteroidota bacterium]
MDKSSPLHQLIHALTPGEKRYFSLSLSRYEKKEKNSLLLFDALLRMKKYDGKKLEKSFAGTKTGKNLAVEKHLLYERLLVSLAACHISDSSRAQLHELVRQGELLLEKALYAACYRRLQSARKIGYELEEHAALLEILRLEREMLNDGKIKGKLEDLHREEKELVAAMTERQELTLLNNEFFGLMKSSAVRETEKIAQMADIISRLDRFDPENLRSARAKATFFGMKLRYSRVIGDTEQQKKYSLLSLALLEKNPSLINENIRGYFSRLINMAISYGENGDANELEITIEKIRMLPQRFPGARDPHILHDIQSAYFGLSLEMRLQQGDFAKGLALVPAVSEWLAEKEQLMDRNHRMVIYMTVADLYFMAGDYRKTLQWLRGVVHESNIGFRDDVQCFAYILQLVTHYKLGHDDLLPSLLKSTYRFLHKRKKMFRVEQLVLGFIATQIRRPATSVDLRLSFKALHEALLGVVQDKIERKALDFFDLVSWLESEISGEGFSVTVARKSKLAGK